MTWIIWFSIVEQIYIFIIDFAYNLISMHLHNSMCTKQYDKINDLLVTHALHVA